MQTAEQIKYEFKGIRLQIDSPYSFDEVLGRLREQTGTASIPQINEMASRSRSVEEFDADVTRRFVGRADLWCSRRSSIAPGSPVTALTGACCA